MRDTSRPAGRRRTRNVEARDEHLEQDIAKKGGSRLDRHNVTAFGKAQALVRGETQGDRGIAKHAEFGELAAIKGDRRAENERE